MAFRIPPLQARPAPCWLIVGRFGVPALFRSDKGPQFANALIAQLTELLGSEQEFTTAYSKEENAIVERANKEVMRHLRAIVFDDRVYNKWSSNQLPLVMRILNSQEKSRTGVAPAEILFGNTVDLGRYLLYRPKSAPSPDRNLNEHLEQMLERQKTLIEVAQASQLEFDSHHMSQFDPDFTDYPIQSYVLWEHPADKRSKMHTRYQGPFQVVERQEDIYKIQDLLTGKIHETHVSTLRPFNHDPDKVTPLHVAMHNSQEFVIEEILDHRGDRNRRGTMEFKVRWQGESQDNDSWEPFSLLRDTEQLHTYLREHKLKSLIPLKFRNKTS